MFSANEIGKVYSQYKIDLNVKLPKLIILSKTMPDTIACIGDVNLESAELFIGDIFIDSHINKKYFHSVLYHEFTHIMDRVNILSSVKSDEMEINLLFPYTEFHASQVEMRKKLEIFYNPNKHIVKSTSLYDKYGIVTLEKFLNDEKEDFELRLQELEKSPCIKNIQCILYKIIYNFGYYSVCCNYNIDGDLFINIRKLKNVFIKLLQLKELLINKEPSEILYKSTNIIANNIVSTIEKLYKC